MNDPTVYTETEHGSQTTDLLVLFRDDIERLSSEVFAQLAQGPDPDETILPILKSAGDRTIATDVDTIMRSLIYTYAAIEAHNATSIVPNPSFSYLASAVIASQTALLARALTRDELHARLNEIILVGRAARARYRKSAESPDPAVSATQASDQTRGLLSSLGFSEDELHNLANNQPLN